jgi:arsenite methyltransferase
MLEGSRLAPHFSFIGDFSRHYGLFEGSGTTIPFDGGATPMATSATNGACC